MTRASPNWPRLLSVDLAASYVGIGETSFRAGVARGDWPEPLPLGRRKLWDINKLDDRVDQLAGGLSGNDGQEWMESLNDAS